MNYFVVVIPARYASERLPGKPLREIAGKTMLQHVYERAEESKASEIMIATDDQRISDAAEGFGAAVCMTGSHHRSGTERIEEVSRQMKWPDDQVVINLQGDEPLMPADVINQCAELLDNGSIDMATLASPLASRSDYENPNVVKVVCDNYGNAIYFSRSPIPHSRSQETAELAVQTAMHHHGIYAYRCAALRAIVAAKRSDPEACEQLEQLRALAIGIRIKVAKALSRPPAGVDTEEDLDQIERLLSGQ
jgi:3-deoxy-manno-octulosonate cytidylyltransferase (CMP-KDO synthetase)